MIQFCIELSYLMWYDVRWCDVIWLLKAMKVDHDNNSCDDENDNNDRSNKAIKTKSSL